MKSQWFFPANYSSILSLKQTEKAIKLIKDAFEMNLSSELNLTRVTAPLFVKKGTGVNDDLNGIEKPVSFSIQHMANTEAEIVQSLAKWKRMILGDYSIPYGYGIYADMNAIRPSEVLDNIHSLYVDQWDWEKVMSAEERNIEFLKQVVTKIYGILKRVEFIVYDHYDDILPILPETITFIHSEELYAMYPDIPARQREYEAAKKYGAVFIIGIGAELPDKKPHDNRAPDYDDWITVNDDKNGYKGLNGDIILWNSLLQNSYEISSMGIRVNQDSLLQQLALTCNEHRKNLYFHKRLLNGELPLSIGGGIGQSRLCMFFLRKAHIGEIQASIWPDDMVSECKANNIFLL